MQTYFALVHKDAGSAYGISFPDLPGCFSAADHEEDIFAQAQAALALYACDGERMPDARLFSALQNDADVRAEVASGAFLIAVPVINISHKARYNLMLPTDLVSGIDKTVKALGMNRSEFVADAVEERLKQQSGVVFRRVSGDFTSKKVSSAASKILHSKSASKAEKLVAASALTQRRSKEVTGVRVASSASKILKDPKASKAAKSVAASTLTLRTNKKSVAGSALTQKSMKK